MDTSNTPSPQIKQAGSNKRVMTIIQQFTSNSHYILTSNLPPPLIATVLIPLFALSLPSRLPDKSPYAANNRTILDACAIEPNPLLKINQYKT